ncbi:MAG: hypothetical protein AAF206_28670, partial [Bacteroidota bacterium]
MSKKLTIQFHAFIPESYGKSLKELFPKTLPWTQPGRLQNRESFFKKISKITGTWMAEPGPVVVPNWGLFGTNNRELGKINDRLTFKVGTKIEVDPNAIGEISHRNSIVKNETCNSHQVIVKSTRIGLKNKAEVIISTPKKPVLDRNLRIIKNKRSTANKAVCGDTMSLPRDITKIKIAASA